MTITSGIPMLGDYGVTDEDIYAAAGTAAIAYFLLGQGYILPMGMDPQSKVMAVGGITLLNLLVKHFIKMYREKSQA